MNINELRTNIEKDIVCLDIEYIDFNGSVKIGKLEVNKFISNEVKEIFQKIKELKFPISKMNTIDNYNYSDEESVIDNNTSGYNFRVVLGTNKLSDHSLGLAIDINPVQNPWMDTRAIQYPYDVSAKGTILKDSKIVKLLKSYGWNWGGDWKVPDYQHFNKIGPIYKQIKSKYVMI